MRTRRCRSSALRAPGSAGVAAIEFLFVLPVLLLLFLGMVNLTDYISMHRRVNAAAGLMTDLVTRHEKTIDKAAMTDYATAVKLAMRPFDQSIPHIDVYAFYKVRSD
jgi:Flp pilus assembly protein TadG